MRNSSVAWASFLFLFLVSTAQAAAPPDAELILKKADEIRNPAESFWMEVQVQSPGEEPSESAFEVSIQGNNKTLIRTLEPARDRGRNLLMLDEEMWLFVPNLKRAVRVGLNQKLTGQAANGDISRMRWSGDYQAQLVKEDASEWELFLTATKKGLTYEKIRVWVSRKDFRPVRAEYLSLGEKTLKRASFSEFQLLAGALRPSQIRIEDAVRTERVSTIRIQKMEVRQFPSSLFNQNSLK